MAVTLETQLEDYDLEREIGRGDLTIVYEAQRKSDGAKVAIKIVPPQFTFDELFVQRFQDAAHKATKLEHPNIVRTYEAGQEDNVLYVVRELIQARSLGQILDEEGPMPPQKMMNIARQIAAALDYAHQKSIIHGDLSASRVFVAENDVVTITDFGQTNAVAGTSLAKKGFAVGAPETTAPERIQGQSPSRQSDLYSLGILCYQMLAGVPPFTGTPAAVLHAQAYEQPHPLHLINPTIPVSLSESIDRMLSKGSELRYITGAEFARALEMATKGTAPMRSPATTTAQLKAAGLKQRSVWSSPWLWGGLGLLLIMALLMLGFGLVSLWNLRQPAVVAATPTSPLAGQQQAVAPPATETATAPAEIVSAPATNTPQATAPPATPSPLPTATPSPTFVPIPTPGPPVVAQDSPFTNFILAHNIGQDSSPQDVGTAFAPGSQPIYVFFDYENIEPGTAWAHRWTWGDTELDSFEDVWPDSYAESGLAWVFYSPAGGFQPGPYTVTIEVDNQIVATVSFVVQPGGI